MPDILVGKDCFGLRVLSALNGEYRHAVDLDRKDREGKLIALFSFAFKVGNACDCQFAPPRDLYRVLP